LNRRIEMQYKFLTQEQKDAMTAFEEASKEYGKAQSRLYKLRASLPPMHKRTIEQHGEYTTMRFIVSEAAKKKITKREEYLAVMDIRGTSAFEKMKATELIEREAQRALEQLLNDPILGEMTRIVLSAGGAADIRSASEILAGTAPPMPRVEDLEISKSSSIPSLELTDDNLLYDPNEEGISENWEKRWEQIKKKYHGVVEEEKEAKARGEE
jgi:hypothetical protein